MCHEDCAGCTTDDQLDVTMWAGNLPLIQHQTCYRPSAYSGFPHIFYDAFSWCAGAHFFVCKRTDSAAVQSNTFLNLSVLPGFNLSFIPLNANWFRSYSRAVLEDDPDVARLFVKNAIDLINEKLKEPDLDNDERKAISSAVHVLRLVEQEQLQRVG